MPMKINKGLILILPTGEVSPSIMFVVFCSASNSQINNCETMKTHITLIFI